MNALPPQRSSHPLAAFGLDMLARGAAHLRGDRPALGEAGPGAIGGASTYRDLDRLVVAFGARAMDCGLEKGDRVLIVGATRVGVVAAMLGALSAGLEPVMAPAHFPAGALAFLAQSTGARAIFTPTLYGGLEMETTMLEAAAHAPDVRLVGSLGPGGADGAIDFSPRALDLDAAERPLKHGELPRIGFVLKPGEKAPRATFLTQNTLVSHALDLVSALQLSTGRTILSTLSPASVTGFVAGPVAALLAGAPLTLFGPFDATGLEVLTERATPGCLVAPGAAVEDFVAAGICDGLDCLAVASRAPAPPAPCPVVRIASDDEGRILVSVRKKLESAASPPHSAQTTAG
ncbi:MAG: acyl--CoA ligase [Hyphomicrobiales bacterium]|nr:acyl--CoA ligase [Hyphomicrobiales bacterium]